MDKTALLLVIHEDSTEGEYLRQALASGAGWFRVQWVDCVATALARIAGRGVDLVILDLSLSQKPEIERLDSFLKLRGAAPQMPIVVVCDSEEDSLLLRAVQAGAADQLPRARCSADLSTVVRSAIGRHLVPPEPRPHLGSESRQAGAVIAFLGAKGGVGATTVALNAACGLTQWGTVILTELRPMLGTLSLYFRPRHLAGNIARLLEANPGTTAPAEIQACLWPCKAVPGLSILFGPQTIEECWEIAARPAQAILHALSMLADYVVVDLPPSFSMANRAVMLESDSLVLVVEREPLCVKSAKLILETICGWDALSATLSSVIVNRVPLITPMDLSEIQVQLAIPTLGVMPPATDLCVAAEQAGTPLPLFDPDSFVAHSMMSLANSLAIPIRRPARAS